MLKTRLKRAGKIVGINVALVVVVLLVAEVVFGSWFFGPKFGLLVVPRNVDLELNVEPLYGGGMSHYVRDEYGLRGDFGEPSNIELLVMGGSTTNELMVGEGKTWSDVIAADFRANAHPVIVGNAGVDGQSTVGHIKCFDLWFPKIDGLRPRYVLALVGINDLGAAMSGGSAVPDELIEPNKKLKRFLTNYSVVYGLYRNVKGMVRARSANLIHSDKGYNGSEWVLPETPPDIAAAEHKWAAFLSAHETNVRELAKRIRDWGATPIFVTQHRADYRVRDGKVYGRVLEDGSVSTGLYVDLMAFNRHTMRTCRDIDAVCIDLADELFFEDWDHYDPLHTTPTGSAKIGHYLYGKLKDVIR